MKKQGVGLLDAVLTCMRCGNSTRFNHPDRWKTKFEAKCGPYQLNTMPTIIITGRNTKRKVFTGSYCCESCTPNISYAKQKENIHA